MNNKALRFGHRLGHCLCIPLVLVVLQGCGSGSNGNAPASQVAARVNGGEITVYRVNSAIAASSKAGNTDPDAQAQMRRKVLDSLIDQELAAQAAETSKLDRTPAVMQAIESARREVLARAWLDQVLTTLPKPDASQISRYFADHPELFSQRHVYNLQQIALKSDPALLGELRRQVDAGSSIQQIGHWLDEKKVRFSAAGGVRTAEQIPLDILATLSKAKDGQILLIEQPQSILVVHVLSSALQPVAEADAAPKIGKFLANQALTDAIGSEMKRLKTGAAITYMGEFSLPATTLPAATPEAQASITAATTRTSISLGPTGNAIDKATGQEKAAGQP